MSYGEDDFGVKIMNHIFVSVPDIFTVVKPVMLTITCNGEASRQPTFFNPDTYPLTADNIGSCALPISFSYSVDTVLDPGKTTTYFQCDPCIPGTFSSVAGSDQCNLCWAGSYQQTSGETTCNDCPPGSVSDDGQPVCTPCPVNSFHDGITCQDCPVGTYTVSINSTACLGCPENTWSSGERDGCQPCPPWSTSTGGKGPSGCICHEGLYLYIGAYEEGGGLECLQCPAGTFSGRDTNVCIPCPSGTYGDVTAMGACKACPSGEIAPPGSTACVECTYPQIPTEDRRMCQDCPKGTVCLAYGEVVTCPAGTYGAYTGATSLDACMTCPPGQVCGDPSAPEQCPPNTYSEAGASSMLECKCQDGYDCTYTKALRGKVLLPVEPENFDENMRLSLIQSIAEAAGVSPDRVRIISIEPYSSLSTRSVRKEGGWTRRTRKTVVQVRVMGATSLQRVEKALQRHGLPPATKIRIRGAWDHHVEAKALPARGFLGAWV